MKSRRVQFTVCSFTATIFFARCQVSTIWLPSRSDLPVVPSRYRTIPHSAQIAIDDQRVDCIALFSSALSRRIVSLVIVRPGLSATG